MTRTYLTVSEKTDPNRHRSLYILHNGWEWYHADFNNKKQMDGLLAFLECEIISVEKTTESEFTGKVIYYNLSKDVISLYGGGFWNISQMLKQAGNRRVKPFIGLSNGCLTVCYAAFDDENNTVEILRPNPNAKDIYPTMHVDIEIEYRRNHWYI